MKPLGCALALAVLVGASLPDVASADRGRGVRHDSRLGVYIGVPLYWNWPSPYYRYPAPYSAYPPHYYPNYYPYSPYYAYPPPTVVVPSSPPVYIEREDDAAPSRADGYWYYCDRPEGYYPYVRECPGGWERVAPTPSR